MHSVYSLILFFFLKAASYFGDCGGRAAREKGLCEWAGKVHTTWLRAESRHGCGSSEGLSKEISFLKQVVFRLFTVSLQGIFFCAENVI